MRALNGIECENFKRIHKSVNFQETADRRVYLFASKFFESGESAEMIKKLLLAIFLLTFSAVLTPAQVSPEQEIINARAQSSDIKNRSLELERIKRETYKRPVSEDFAPNFPKIKEDFEKIQKINSEILRINDLNSPANYADVLKSVSEINHRAVRLRSNLFTDDTKSKNKRQNNDERQDIKILLAVLDKSINSFVHSSIFQNTNLVNSEDSLKAQKDLETVINVSNTIKSKTKN